MSNRKREVIGAHSTWFICDEHDWEFIEAETPEEDYCPVCKGEAVAEERILNSLVKNKVIRRDALGSLVFVNCDTLAVEYLSDTFTGEN